MAGFAFAVLWASASTATKIGLASAQPLVIAVIRFGIAAAIMLFISHIIGKHRLPRDKEWMQVAFYGLLNITIYLGCYVVAMQTVTAGIGALAVATNPVFISFLSVFFLKKKLTVPLVLALVICSAGVLVASWPLFDEAQVTGTGLSLLVFSMISYSVAALYFSSSKWSNLHLFTINGWQTLIGGLLLLPVTWFYYEDSKNVFDKRFWGAAIWLSIPVSIFAVQCWLWLLKADAVKAGMWLFLCPVFGFIIAALFVGDHISGYTVTGVVLVLTGLFLSQRNLWDR
jgi:probable blue pigment (indigoidine) exporter